MRTPSSWPGFGLRGASAVAALLALGFGMAAAIAPADASKVGVAAAVNPDAFSSLSGTPTNQLNIGKSIFFNERIKTTDSGLVQVLLVDGSTFTVGPGSDLVIDKFVYNPKKGTGEITTTFSKGVVRYVGGKISKNADAVKMKTPAGALAIRGGMFQAKINAGGKGIFSFLYGVGLTFTGKNGQTYKVFQPGYTLDLSSGTPTIRPTTASDTNVIMKAFAKGGSGTGNAGTGGDGGTKPGPGTNTTQASNTISEIINTFTQTQLQTTLVEELRQLHASMPEKPIPDVGDTSNPDLSTPPGELPPPDPRVGGEFTGYATGLLQQGAGRPEIVGTLSPDDMAVILDPDVDGDTVLAGVRFTRAGVKGILPPLPWTKTYNLVFGGTDYIDDATFSASGRAGNSSVTIWEKVFQNWQLKDRTTQFGVSDFTGSFATRSALQNQALPQTLCTSCEFIKWGAWNAAVTYAQGSNGTTDSFQHGLWVAGQVTDNDALPRGMSATYDGTAVGSVARQSNSGWQQYMASGDLHMSWDFDSRRGQLAISKFDTGFKPGGLSFSGPLAASQNANQFVGVLGGSGLVGAATGSFVSHKGNPAAGVIGNWSGLGIVDRRAYQATGIFGGAQTSVIPRQ